MPRVDYSELVVALQNGDDSTANQVLDEVMPRLVEYLQVAMNAEKREAKECAQQAFLDVFEQIRKDNIRDHKYIFSYMIRATRNEFLHYKKYQHRFTSDPTETYHLVEPAQQIVSLVEEDRMNILEECLEELESDNKIFIQFFMENPEATTKQASRHFKITGGNVRTKKSRIVNRLHHCYKRKSSDL